MRNKKTSKVHSGMDDLSHFLNESSTAFNMEVFRGIHKITKQEVDIKAVNKKELSPEEVEKLRDEIQLHKMAVHHGVIRLLDYFEHRDCLYLVTEKPNEVYHQEDEQVRQEVVVESNPIGNILAVGKKRSGIVSSPKQLTN
mmetsp:Transcript_28930/g.43680  ORF Transcript_28930/g.43680 Transcript_28930/m.43680 type:complete len:141 (-) Transcript_28930:81-503(-)